MKPGYRFILKAGAPPIAWGKPNSPRRELCGLCHGPLDEAPLILFTDAGYALSLCDACVDTWVEIEKI